MTAESLYDYFERCISRLPSQARLILVLDPPGLLELGETVEVDQRRWIVFRYDGNDLAFRQAYGHHGPDDPHLVWTTRPPDHPTTRPKDVVFIQCVGSRDVNYNPYCSSVCCMFATKEAILANEHDPASKSYIFYTDLRAGGKRFQEYISRAKNEYQTTYIRGRPGRVSENSETGDPIVRYEDTTVREVQEMEVDLVVLCQALIPRNGQKEVAKVLGIQLDEYGFVRTPEWLLHPTDTSMPGIFACGYCQSPQDIPDSIAQASGVAARVAELLLREERLPSVE